MRVRHLLPLLLLASCTDPAPEQTGVDPASSPILTTKADSVAWSVLQACGGEVAWQQLPYLQFQFTVERGGERGSARKHAWDRMTGDYRLEYDRGIDTTVVVLFNTMTREGAAYIDGEPASDGDALVERAYASFINDTYWLMMPVKMLDPGVDREYVADSSDSETDVIRLSFGDVGLTPDDQYWVFVERSTGMVRQWDYLLQGAQDRPPRRYRWTGYEEHATAAGPITLATRKEGTTVAILTDRVSTPPSVPDGYFSDPMPRLD